MSSLQTRARSHYRRQRTIALLAVRAARQALRGAQSPSQAQVELTRSLSRHQLLAARVASAAMAGELDRAPLVDALAFTGTTQRGYPISLPLKTIVDRAVRQSPALDRLPTTALSSLDLFIHAEVAASGSDAAAVELTASRATYVRVLNPPACDRCTILAGRTYKSHEAFIRHPGCDCVHWPVASRHEAEEAGLIVDPMEAFDQGLITGLSRADAQAIRDGADIISVVNAKRDMYTISADGKRLKATRVGTTKSGAWRQANPQRAGAVAPPGDLRDGRGLRRGAGAAGPARLPSQGPLTPQGPDVSG